MSALPPKADIGTQSSNVRFVPKADISPVGHNVVPVPVYSRNHRKLDGYLRTRPFRFGSASTRARDRAMLKASKAQQAEKTTMPSERSVRHRAKRLGYHVTKSRERKHVPHNRFCYMLINANRNLVVGQLGSALGPGVIKTLSQ